MPSRTIVLGVTGGIAAYKSCELASRLTQDGIEVHVVMTEAAQRFVQPLTFQALTHQPVHTTLWPPADGTEAGVYAAMAHIGLADRADAILIAPASADFIAKLAYGLADDLLSTLVLATRAPVLIAPVMNPTMLAHPATQKNLATLRELGYHIIDPESGRMACEHIGTGRLPETSVLRAALDEVLNRPATPSPAQTLSGKTVLVTAGPTREAIDPVRYISNRSSGRMGYEIAAEAQARGANVILVSGPSNLATPAGVERINVTTTQEMLNAVVERAVSCDIVIAAAAPADYRPVQAATQKIKKRETGDAGLKLELMPTTDIVATVGHSKKTGQIVVGFAAETQNTVDEARLKLRTKHLDAIVANDVTESGAGFEVDTNRVTWITEQRAEEWPLLSKREVAARIFDAIKAMKS
jgi:phosphopantothenoylcysteine decarboxylase/phosphopantothenate--cysteine ligase